MATENLAVGSSEHQYHCSFTHTTKQDLLASATVSKLLSNFIMITCPLSMRLSRPNPLGLRNYFLLLQFDILLQPKIPWLRHGCHGQWSHSPSPTQISLNLRERATYTLLDEECGSLLKIRFLWRPRNSHPSASPEYQTLRRLHRQR